METRHISYPVRRKKGAVAVTHFPPAIGVSKANPTASNEQAQFHSAFLADRGCLETSAAKPHKSSAA
jgi:hypothetical protein